MLTCNFYVIDMYGNFYHSWWLSTKADMGLIWTVYVSLAEYSNRP